MRFVRPFAQEDLVVMALSRDFDEKEVEVSREAWPHVSAGEDSVNFSRIRCVPNGLLTFPTDELVLVAAVIDQLVLLLFNRVAALGRFGARLWPYGDLW